MSERGSNNTLIPIMLSVQGKTAVVIGGGAVATRRIRSLLEAGTKIVVISPTVTEDIKTWHHDQCLQWKAKEFDKTDIKAAALIIAATNQPAVHLQVYEAARKDQLLNIADRPDLSDFFVPATLRRGKFVVSISTSGASPGLSRHIKQQLATMYDENYENYVEFLSKCRQYVQTIVPDQSRRTMILKQLLHSRFLHMNEQERERAFRKVLEKEGGKQNE